MTAESLLESIFNIKPYLLVTGPEEVYIRLHGMISGVGSRPLEVAETITTKTETSNLIRNPC